MVQRSKHVLPCPYETDETAWLEATVELIRQGRLNELDYPNLGEYLADMARRDRREVKSRLTVLIAHLLKWTHQVDKRTGNWRGTIVSQRQELLDLLGRGVLRNHAENVLPQAYANGVELAAAETEVPVKTFPTVCPYTLDELLASRRRFRIRVSRG